MSTFGVVVVSAGAFLTSAAVSPWLVIRMWTKGHPTVSGPVEPDVAPPYRSLGPRPTHAAAPLPRELRQSVAMCLMLAHASLLWCVLAVVGGVGAFMEVGGAAPAATYVVVPLWMVFSISVLWSGVLRVRTAFALLAHRPEAQDVAQRMRLVAYIPPGVAGACAVALLPWSGIYAVEVLLFAAGAFWLGRSAAQGVEDAAARHCQPPTIGSPR